MNQTEALQKLTELLPKLDEAQRIFDQAQESLRALQGEDGPLLRVCVGSGDWDEDCQQRVGRRVDESSPMVDARLPDGSRLHAIIPPVAIRLKWLPKKPLLGPLRTSFNGKAWSGNESRRNCGPSNLDSLFNWGRSRPPYT